MKALTPRQLIEKLQSLPEESMDIPLGTMMDEGGSDHLCPIDGVHSVGEWMNSLAEECECDPEDLIGEADPKAFFLSIASFEGPRLEIDGLFER
jgi:hypothetical protein